MSAPNRTQRDLAGPPRVLTHPAAVTAYERTITIPARRAGMTEPDWIAHKAMAHAYAEADRATNRKAAAA